MNSQLPTPNSQKDLRLEVGSWKLGVDSDRATGMTSRGRRPMVTALAALAGTLLFAYAIRNVGWEEVAAGVRRVGWGLLPILALSGIRFVLRAEAWRQCMPAA